MSVALNRKLAHVHERLQAGDAEGAESLCREVLSGAPRNPAALTLLAIAFLLQGRARDAIAPLEQVIAAEPRHGVALENLGLAYLMLDNFVAAGRVLEQAASLKGASPSVFMRLGVALLKQDKHQEAREALGRALELDSANPDIHLNLGEAADRRGDTAAARRHFEDALRLSPSHVQAMSNLGVIALKQNRPDAARQWFERVLGLAPTSADARHGLAFALIGLGRYREGVGHLRELLRTQGEHAEALSALADALFELGEIDEAETCARRAIASDAHTAKPYATLGDVHSFRGRLDLTVSALQDGFGSTGSINLLGSLTFQLRRLCDWGQWIEAWPKLKSALPDTDELVSPFSLLCEPLTATKQLRYARRWSAQFNSEKTEHRPVRENRARIRIGYFSSDFYEHATAYLLAEVLELHDRNKFEVFAYSYGPDDQSAMRCRLRAACEHFVDIAHDPDDVAASRIRGDRLDLLVDLKGYTLGARPSILARRPCVRQVSWLGYPGTMGADFIDFLIADNFIIPKGEESNYSEQVLRLPNCYQPNDRKRPIAEPLTRTDYGLPEHGFVFCAFNQSYKITPEVFNRWMSILRHTQDSVLWLLEDNHWATENLRNAARNENVDPMRLIFAPKIALAQHLARYRSADLALDTFPYGSHTTASDALWSGCLLVGLCGNTFAARVSGSILSACGLTELIAYTLDDYEHLALRMATDQPFRNELRAKLQSGLACSALFDTTMFTRNLENVYAGLIG